MIADPVDPPELLSADPLTAEQRREVEWFRVQEYHSREGLVAIIDSLEARHRQMTEALEEYGMHRPTCPAYRLNVACTCGFAAALRSSTPSPPTTGAEP